MSKDVKQHNPVTNTELDQMSGAVQVQEPSLMNLIASMATDSTADVAKLEKLIDLQNSVLDREAKKSFAKSYIKMKPTLPRVVSLHDNTQTKSKYAKLEDINRVIEPLLEPYGFALMTKISQTEKAVTAHVELWHVDGHIEQTSFTIPLDDKGPNGTVNKTGPHATMSAEQYAKRGGVCALLNISTGQDVDGNRDSDKITMEQAVELDERLRALGGDALARFLRFAKIEQLPELLAKNYAAAQKAISNTEEEAKKERAKQ